jgi:SecD/SecF fusion protein
MNPKTRNIVALATIAVLAAVSFWQFWPIEDKITQGLDIKGGLSLILTAKPLGGETITEATMDRVETILIERVNGFGLSEATVQRQGTNQFFVQLPGVSDPDEARESLKNPGRLEFVELESITDTATLALANAQMELFAAGESTTTELDPSTYEPIHETIGSGEETREETMTGGVITDTQVSTDDYGNGVVNLTMNADGAEVWAKATARIAAAQGHVMIVLDGRAQTAPKVIGSIDTGDTQITGYTIEEARRLAAVLQAGALPAELEMSASTEVDALLGRTSLEQGLLAGLIGLAFVAVFMAVYYRALGVLSWISLALYGMLLFGTLAVLSSMGIFSLTLPGIAGIILTIGVAADTSILIFERLKEEVEAGKTYRSAAKSGVRHAIGTSIDADVVTLVSAIALYVFAIGPVRGFAFTLILGIVIDLVVALLFTGPVVRMFAESVMPKMPRLFGVKAGGSHV